MMRSISNQWSTADKLSVFTPIFRLLSPKTLILIRCINKNCKDTVTQPCVWKHRMLRVKLCTPVTSKYNNSILDTLYSCCPGLKSISLEIDRCDDSHECEALNTELIYQQEQLRIYNFTEIPLYELMSIASKSQHLRALEIVNCNIDHDWEIDLSQIENLESLVTIHSDATPLLYSLINCKKLRSFDCQNMDFSMNDIRCLLTSIPTLESLSVNYKNRSDYLNLLSNPVLSDGVHVTHLTITFKSDPEECLHFINNIITIIPYCANVTNLLMNCFNCRLASVYNLIIRELPVLNVFVMNGISLYYEDLDFVDQKTINELRTIEHVWLVGITYYSYGRTVQSDHDREVYYHSLCTSITRIQDEYTFPDATTETKECSNCKYV